MNASRSWRRDVAASSSSSSSSSFEPSSLRSDSSQVVCRVRERGEKEVYGIFVFCVSSSSVPLSLDNKNEKLKSEKIGE